MGPFILMAVESDVPEDESRCGNIRELAIITVNSISNDDWIFGGDRKVTPISCPVNPNLNPGALILIKLVLVQPREGGNTAPPAHIF